MQLTVAFISAVWLIHIEYKCLELIIVLHINLITISIYDIIYHPALDISLKYLTNQALLKVWTVTAANRIFNRYSFTIKWAAMLPKQTSLNIMHYLKSAFSPDLSYLNSMAFNCKDSKYLFSDLAGHLFCKVLVLADSVEQLTTFHHFHDNQ